MYSEQVQSITQATKNLLLVLKKEFPPQEEKNLPKIQVSQLVSKIAFLYEKIRNAIEYKEEHLLRKNAIKRILKRRFNIGATAEKVAQPLIYELIQARYLANNAVPEKRIQEVIQIINKYIILLNRIFTTQKRNGREKSELFEWMLGVLACEIEDLFAPHFKEEALVEFMYQIIHKKVVCADKISEEEKNIQVYIAIHRALIKSDREIIAYRLFRLYYPNWTNPSKELIKEIAENINLIQEAIEDQIDHPLSSRLLRTIRRYIAPFVILSKIIEKNLQQAEQILNQPQILEEAVREVCHEEYRERRIKLRRSSVRSIIYIFLTKMLLAFLFEVPYDLFFVAEVNYFPLIINIIFPPFLLFLIALSIKVPAGENTNKIVKFIKQIVYKNEIEFSYTIKPQRRRLFLNFSFNIVYAIVFVAAFSIIIFVLNKLQFNIVSMVVFILFLCLVSFFGIRNRETARELIVVGEKEGIRTAIVDFFAIPILRAGRWISLNFSKINILVFIFDFIIEAPFKAFTEIIEDFLAFIKEKKEEITLKD